MNSRSKTTPREQRAMRCRFQLQQMEQQRGNTATKSTGNNGNTKMATIASNIENSQNRSSLETTQEHLSGYNGNTSTEEVITLAQDNESPSPVRREINSVDVSRALQSSASHTIRNTTTCSNGQVTVPSIDNMENTTLAT